jgi:hypothetical protein
MERREPVQLECREQHAAFLKSSAGLQALHQVVRENLATLLCGHPGTDCHYRNSP